MWSTLTFLALGLERGTLDVLNGLLCRVTGLPRTPLWTGELEL